jgi:hypothetical protein
MFFQISRASNPARPIQKGGQNLCTEVMDMVIDREANTTARWHSIDWIDLMDFTF